MDLTPDSTWLSPRSDQGTSDAFRQAMRYLPHSVAVVTTLAESPSLKPSPFVDPSTDNVELLSPYFQDFCGATISSLQSVTLGPPTMISFNLKMPSRTLSGLLHNKQFGIHLLLGNDQGREVADAFIRQPHHEAFRTLSQNGRWVGLGLSPCQRVEDLEKRVPLIRGSGVFSFLKCEVLADRSIQVGDHMVIIAKVASIGLTDATTFTTKRSTLAYVHGDYRRIMSSQDVRTNPKVEDSTVHIRRNSLHIHNDALEASTLSMESTLAKFCQHVRHELPESVQDSISRFLLSDSSWASKAQVLQCARESHAMNKRPTLKAGRGGEWRKGLKMIHANFQARSPSNFWGHPPEDWPSTSPPWNDGVDRFSDHRVAKLDYNKYLRLERVKPAQGSSQDVRKSSIKVRDVPKVGLDPLGALGEEEDGDLSSLSEEGYRNLTKKLGKQRQGQDGPMDGELGERPEKEPMKVKREDVSSVDGSERADTGIPPEEEEVLKASPS